MAFTDTSIPANTESVKLGAQRIRETRAYLNTLAEKFFSSATEGVLTWLTSVIPGAALEALAVTADKLAATLDLSSKTVTLPATSVQASMLAATLDLSGKTLTLPAATVTAANLEQDLIEDMTDKPAPVLADKVILGDSEAAGVVKSATLTAVKATTLAGLEFPNKAFIRFRSVKTTTPAPMHTLYRSRGISLETSQINGGLALYEFTFDTPEADVNYSVAVVERSAGSTPVITKSTTGFTMNIPDTMNGVDWGILVLS